MIGSMQFIKCPSCGESNVDGARRCNICGSDIPQKTPGMPEMVSAFDQASEAGQPGPQPAAPETPPPAQAARQQAPAAQAAPQAGEGRPSGLDPMLILKRHLLPAALGISAVFLLIALGKEAPVETEQAGDPRVEAADAFLAYTLQAGPERGKTMRQFWSDYGKAYYAAQRTDEPQAMKLSFVAQQSPLGGDNFDLFVLERTEGEQGRIYPFRVELSDGQVTPGSACVFAPGTERQYAADRCVRAAEVFPEGL